MTWRKVLRIFGVPLWIWLIVGLIPWSKGYGAEEKQKRTFQFQYWVEITPKASGKISVWMPLPQNTEHQKVLSLSPSLPKGWQFSLRRERAYQNSYLYIEGMGEKGKKYRLGYEAKVVRQMVSFPKKGKSPATTPPAQFLQPSRKVPIDHPKIWKHIHRAIPPKGWERMYPLEVGRQIYWYLLGTMRYDKSGLGWGRGDSLWACDALRGNCTDFHSLFMSMMRTLKIPTRFEIGFPIPEEKKGTLKGYHCWAWFHTPSRGWVPVDISEAWKYPKKRSFFFGNLDANRILLSVGRDLRLEPAPRTQKILNFFVYPLVEQEGKKIEFQRIVSFEEVESQP